MDRSKSRESLTIHMAKVMLLCHRQTCINNRDEFLKLIVHNSVKKYNFNYNFFIPFSNEKISYFVPKIVTN